MNPKIKVTFFQRKPYDWSFSLEFIFEDIRRRLASNFEIQLHVCRYFSQGIFKRIYNLFEAPFYQGDINHVTGDIHYVTFFLKKRNTVLTILDCVFLKRPNGIERSIIKLFWLTLPVKRVKYITAISEATKQDILKNVTCDPDKIKVIPVAISEDYIFSPRPFNKTKTTLLHIGSAPNKNLLRIIDAVEGLDIHMSIVGKINYEIEEKLKKNNIEYTNEFGLSASDIVNKYKNCDVLVFASTYEGFGMPILEAQATGRVVVTSNISSMPEVAGDASCLVDPFDVQSIRQGISKVIENDLYRNELIQKGFENIKRFSPERITQMYTDMYTEIYISNTLQSD